MAVRRLLTILGLSAALGGLLGGAFFSRDVVAQTPASARAASYGEAGPPALQAGRQGGAAAQAGRQGGGGFVAAPARRAGEGLGPFKSLLIRGVMVIDGTGAPPYGPMNVFVENNRILRITSAGTPGLPTRQGGPPANVDQVIDAAGMYLMPGFIDMHVHAGGPPKNAEAEYAYKLWLAHGVTTVRGVPMAAHDFTVNERAREAKNEIVAPHIVNYQRPGSGWSGGAVNTPEKAREWVRWGAANGLDGLKLGAEDRQSWPRCSTKRRRTTSDRRRICSRPELRR